jgi:serine/threonine-protein phosphatase 6 regulatory subunit 3
MFWRVSGLNTSCPVDAILDKEEYTLEELLDEDELVQECKSLNPRLIEFLKKRENVEKLVRYMVEEDDAAANGSSDVGPEGSENGDSGTSSVSGDGEAEEIAGVFAVDGAGAPISRLENELDPSQPQERKDDPDDDSSGRFLKYPFTACEIFCCEVEGIYNTMLENEEILNQFFSLLDKKERPLNTMLAGYFSRVMGALLARRSSDVVSHLQAHPSILNKLVYHVDTTSVAEVLARLAGADDPVGFSESPAVVWLASTDVLQLLVQSLGSDTPSEGQANAAEVLAAIARSTATQLTKSMANESFMQDLVDAALAPHSGTAASHALNVCLALLEPLTVDPTIGRFPVADIHDVLRREAVQCLSKGETLDRLVELLDGDSNTNGAKSESHEFSRELPTTYGVIRPPVGQLRLKIVDLLASLFRTGDPVAERAVMSTTAVQRVMEMFIQYPFNNALHGGVTMLLTAFEEGSSELRQYLLEEAKLVEWIANAPTQLTSETADRVLIKVSKPNIELRAGYCGHLTQIANRLQQCAETCEYTKQFLEDSDLWFEYKKNELDSRNEIESVLAWRCGRPANQSIGLHGMYSSGLGYGHADDDVGDGDFDSDHNRFATAAENDDICGDGNVTATGEPDMGAGAAGNGLKAMSHVSSGELSMDDMEDDEVCFDMDSDEARKKEEDASDGLLELGESLGKLQVGEKKSAGGAWS